MKEAFLHYLWRYKKFNFRQLKSTTGQAIEIIHFGDYNRNDGPDFKEAKIKINGVLWAGQVEMHLSSSDWLKHKHQNDLAYQNVILHVVYQEDVPIYRMGSKQAIPCLELKNRFEPALKARYLHLVANQNWIPCSNELPLLDASILNLWIDRMCIERLETKTKQLEVLLTARQNDWEQTLFEHLAQSIGTKTNKEGFSRLFASLPMKTLRKHQNNLLQIEALLFGQAGFLDATFKEDYPNQLKKEYQFLKHKYQLQSIPPTIWKFLKLRPANFPSIRIAQLAALIHKHPHLFTQLLESFTLTELENLLEVKIPVYWKTHYRFHAISKEKNKTMGKSIKHILIINTIAPILFLYGKKTDQPYFKEKALSYLEEIPAEKNHIIAQWKKLGIKTTSAYQTQGLLQLKRNYCEAFKCLNCPIGHQILKEKK